MDKRIFPIPILTQGPKPSQYRISLLANNQSFILNYCNQFSKTFVKKSSKVQVENHKIYSLFLVKKVASLITIVHVLISRDAPSPNRP